MRAFFCFRTKRASSPATSCMSVAERSWVIGAEGRYDSKRFRWLGPHKGVVQLALASVTNACWDLWAKTRGVPLWKLLLDLSPEEIVATLDLSYLDDELTTAMALEILQKHHPTRASREGV